MHINHKAKPIENRLSAGNIYNTAMEGNYIVGKNDKREFATKVNIDKCNSVKKEKEGIKQKQKESPTVNKHANEKNNELKRKEMLNKVTTEDLRKLCEQLGAFNSKIQKAQEITELRYDLPGDLRELLEREAGELQCLYGELQDAAKHIEATRHQRAALAAEKLNMESQRTKLKADGVAELEVIVSVYDSAMMERWQAVKTGNSVSAVENFLHDVKGKLEAMKNLQILGNQKLADLKDVGKKENNTVKEKKKNKERGGRGRGRRVCSSSRSSSNITNPSQTSLPFLLDTDSEDLLDDGGVHNVLYGLVGDQAFSLPAWAESVIDID